MPYNLQNGTLPSDLETDAHVVVSDDEDAFDDSMDNEPREKQTDEY